MKNFSPKKILRFFFSYFQLFWNKYILKKSTLDYELYLTLLGFFLDRTFENIMALCVIRSGICWFAFEYQKWNWLRPLLWRCIFWTSVGSSKIFFWPHFSGRSLERWQLPSQNFVLQMVEFYNFAISKIFTSIRHPRTKFLTPSLHFWIQFSKNTG